MPTTLYSDWRQECLDRLGVIEILPNANGSNPTATTIVNTRLADSNKPSTFYKGYSAWRGGAATAADYHRWTTTLSGSALTIAGADYTDLTLGTEVIELWQYGPTPEEILRSINRGMRRVYFDLDIPLTLPTDGDMETSGVSNWTAVAGGVPTKVTTASANYWGTQALNVTTAAAGDGVASVAISVNQAEPLYVAALGRLSSGGATAQLDLNLYDATNSALFGTAVGSTEREWQLLWRRENMTATGKSLTVRLLMSGATATFQSAGVFIYKTRDTWMNLPTSANEGFKITGISQLRCQTSRDTGVLDAMTPELVPLEYGRDYTFAHNQASINPYRFYTVHGQTIGDLVANGPLFLHVRRPYADLGSGNAFSSEGSGSVCPIELGVPACCVDLLETVYRGRMPETERQMRLKEMKNAWAANDEARPESRPAVSATVRTGWAGFVR